MAPLIGGPSGTSPAYREAAQYKLLQTVKILLKLNFYILRGRRPQPKRVLVGSPLISAS